LTRQRKKNRAGGSTAAAPARPGLYLNALAHAASLHARPASGGHVNRLGSAPPSPVHRAAKESKSMTDPVMKDAASPAPRPRMQVNPPVFFISAALILAFALFGALFPERAGRLFAMIQDGIVRDFGWFYIVAVALFLIFVLFLMMSRYGDVKLGPDDSEPDYSYLSWFAMLFSAGMGIGLLFFGVAEPIQHYAQPPVGEGRTIEAAREAMVLTFFRPSSTGACMPGQSTSSSAWRWPTSRSGAACR